MLLEENKEKEKQQQLSLESGKSTIVKKERSSIFKRRKHKKRAGKSNVSIISESVSSLPDSQNVDETLDDQVGFSQFLMILLL